MIEVRFVTRAGDVVVKVSRGTSLLGAAVRADVPIGQSCRGEGVCAACEVRVLSGTLRAPDAREAALISRRLTGPSQRFACRARVLGPCAVTTGYW